MDITINVSADVIAVLGAVAAVFAITRLAMHVWKSERRLLR